MALGTEHQCGHRYALFLRLQNACDTIEAKRRIAEELGRIKPYEGAMKAIILARVSTKEQEEGYSIAAQRQRLVEYCARKSLHVIKTFELVESSTRGERKEFAAMLEFAKTQSEIVAIVADAVDRFQRSFKESVLIDELIRTEQVELHFYRENMVIGKGASSTDIMRWDFSVMGAKAYVLNLSENVRRSLDDLPPEKWTPGYAACASACCGVM
jgi:DNA invertase Pin-like site-specific DNA recombinase